MERYKAINEVGGGTFGTVWRATNKQNGEVVAIKKMKRKYYSWEECMNLREVKSLRRMNHPNVVKLKEVIRENDQLYFVFEYMDCSLYQLMKERGKPFSEVEVRNWCFQIFQALAYIHQHGYFHRDLKPENLLVTKKVIKIADFGLAREISSKPPFTEYVSTRWYRAPEVLLQSSFYGSAVDMWAMGAIIAELFTFQPLFPGSSEADELYKICSIIGTPDENSWAEGLLLADAINFQFSRSAGVPLSVLIPAASAEAISLISSLCSWNPNKRLTAVEVLRHSFFQPLFYVPPSLRHRTSAVVPNTPPPVGMKQAFLQKTSRGYSQGVSDRKPESNLSITNVNASFKTGVQRKLDMDNINNKEFEKNDFNLSLNRPLIKQKPGFLTRESRMVSSDVVWKSPHLESSSNSVANVTERLQHLMVSSVPRTVRQSPALKYGGWHNHTDIRRPYEVPSARNYSPRKVAS